MAELKRRAHRSRQAFQKLGQHGLIGLEIRRKLKKQRPEPSGALQSLQRTEKALQKFFRVLQALDVRKHLVRLDGETKMFGRFRDPVLDGRLL